MVDYDIGYETVMNIMVTHRIVDLDNGVLREFSTRTFVLWLLNLQNEFERQYPFVVPPEIVDEPEKIESVLQEYRFQSLLFIRHFGIFNFDNGHIDYFKDTKKNPMEITPFQRDFIKDKKIFTTDYFPLPQKKKPENKKIFLLNLQKISSNENGEIMDENTAFQYLEIAEKQMEYAYNFFVSRCGEDNVWKDTYMTACWTASIMLAKNMALTEYFSSLKRFFDRFLGDVVMYYRSQSISHWMTKDRIKAKRLEKEAAEAKRIQLEIEKKKEEKFL